MTNATPLRVLHVIASLAAEDGGPPAICAGLTAALAARGHHLTIATVQRERDATPVATAAAVTVQSFPRDGSARYSHSAALDRWLDAHVRDFDIAHIHSIWQFPTFAAARACRRHRVPYVVLLNGMLDRHAIGFRSRWLKHAYWLLRERHNLRDAAALHCGNRAEIRHAVDWIAHDPKFIIGNGVHDAEIAAFPPPGAFRAAHPQIAGRPLALFLSRLHPKKGLDRLLPAWRPLAQRQPDLRLVIAGAGDPQYVAALDRLIAELGLATNVLRVGQLIGPAKWQALLDADLFVLPSHQEGFSMAITEALAAGCPPIVTDACNFDELEPPPPQPSCGVIVHGDDMSEFVRQVELLLADPPRRRTLAAAARHLVATRFTWQVIAADLERVYRWVLAGNPLHADGTDSWRP